MLTKVDFRNALSNAVTALSRKLSSKDAYDGARDNASATIAAAAAIEKLLGIRNDRETVLLLANVKSQLGDNFGRFKQTLYQARKVLDYFGANLAKDWASDGYAENNTLGKMYKRMREEQGLVKTPTEQIIAKLDKLHSDDLRDIVEACAKLLDKRQATIVTTVSTYERISDSDPMETENETETVEV